MMLPRLCSLWWEGICASPVKKEIINLQVQWFQGVGSVGEGLGYIGRITLGNHVTSSKYLLLGSKPSDIA